jgi:hypothetical protein
MLLLAGALSATTKTQSSDTSRSASSKKSTAHVHHAKSTSGKHGKKSAKTKKVKGQQGIDSQRARAIQTALIREHYLDGEPSGSFDQRTKDALTKYQRDNGWQSKVIPDSRALIKLGLGPSKDGLLNPESAAMGSPYQLGTEREIPGGAPATPAQRK